MSLYETQGASESGTTTREPGFTADRKPPPPAVPLSSQNEPEPICNQPREGIR